MQTQVVKKRIYVLNDREIKEMIGIDKEQSVKQIVYNSDGSLTIETTEKWLSK